MAFRNRSTGVTLGSSMELDTIIEEYSWLIRYLVQKKVNAADVDDVTQTILLIICQNYRSIRDPGGTGAWVRTIVRNHIVNYYRRKSREQAACDHQDFSQPDGIEPDNVFERIDRDVSVSDLLERLPEKYRQVMVLRYIDQMTVREIGKKLDLDPREISNLLSYGKRLLVKRYSGKKLSIK